MISQFLLRCRYNLHIGLIFIVFTVFIVPASANPDINVNNDPPNIILIIADDLGWGDVGFHGSDISTPNIDRLAMEGVILDRFYVAPICSPTRAGLLTGRYPVRYGLRNNVIRPWLDFGLDTSEVLISELLEEAGYGIRAIIGKWHLGHMKIEYYPLKRGYNYFYGHVNGAIDYFDKTREGQPDWHEGYMSADPEGYTTDMITSKAVEVIRYAHNMNTPFLIHVAYNAPHSPLQAQKEYLLKYGYDETSPPYQAGKGKGNTARQTYSAMVTNLDNGIGEVLNTIAGLGLADNTIVLFLSDNGADSRFGGSNGELRGGKHSEWEGGVRVPAIIRWPEGFTGGWKCSQLTGFIDLFPTIQHLVKPDYHQVNKTDGIDILPVLSKEVDKIDREFYVGNGVLIKDQWKIIKANNENRIVPQKEDQLYNLIQDPTESTNLLFEDPEKFSDLVELLDVYESIESSQPPPSDLRPEHFKPPRNWEVLAAPDTCGTWIQPCQDKAAWPVWGHAKGIQVGLAPLSGPRGLLRVYTPYLGIDNPKMLNFIAFEPVSKEETARGFSELEISTLDKNRGKRFWSADDSLNSSPRDPMYPAKGIISTIKDEEVLTLYIFSEPFFNGAKVYVRLRFYETRPYEFELATYKTPDSEELENFILTATMGNLARLRNLYLKYEMMTSLDIWPDYNDLHFADHAVFPLNKLIRDSNGSAYFIASPNEKNTRDAEYAPGTRDHWKYKGDFATQYWISMDPDPQLSGLVNGRVVYWASESPIPGGIAFENFELKEPFRNGARFIFGISPEMPEDIIDAIH